MTLTLITNVSCLVWERRACALFQKYTLACQQQFLGKSSAQHEIRCFFIHQHSVISNNFFSTYCTVFLKLHYRDIVAFRTKIECMIIWSLTFCSIFRFPFIAIFTFPNIAWSFSMPLWCNKHLPGQSASITIAFKFFGMFVSTRTPSGF